MTTMPMESRAVPQHLRRDLTRTSRLSSCLSDGFWATQAVNDALWHELPEDVGRGLVLGDCKRLLIGWIRGLMAEVLTEHQREYVELYYFRGLSCRDMAVVMGVNKSTANRGVQRGVRTIRDRWDARDCPADVAIAAMEYTGRNGFTEHREIAHAGPA